MVDFKAGEVARTVKRTRTRGLGDRLSRSIRPRIFGGNASIPVLDLRVGASSTLAETRFSGFRWLAVMFSRSLAKGWRCAVAKGVAPEHPSLQDNDGRISLAAVDCP